MRAPFMLLWLFCQGRLPVGGNTNTDRYPSSADHGQLYRVQVFPISEKEESRTFPDAFDNENKLLWKGGLFCSLLGNKWLWSWFKHLCVANHKLLMLSKQSFSYCSYYSFSLTFSYCVISNGCDWLPADHTLFDLGSCTQHNCITFFQRKQAVLRCV